MAVQTLPLSVSVVVIPTAMVKVFINNKFVGLHRAFGDTGSVPNLVKHRAVKEFVMNAVHIHGSIVGIGASPVRVKKKLNMSIQPWFAEDESEKINANFLVLPKESKWEPIFPIRDVPCNALMDKLKPNLADPTFWKSSGVSLLLGIKVWSAIIEGSSYKIDNQLLYQESMLGGLISGSIGRNEDDEVHVIGKQQVYNVNINELEQIMKKFWEFEDLQLCTKKSFEDELTEQMYQETHYRNEQNRHVVKIPIKPTVTELGDSRSIALRRFFILEKRFARDENYHEQYVQKMRENIEKGYMVEATRAAKGMTYYIPHHAVCTSKKHRIVYDASCKTSLGISLNEAQFKGPKLQRNLYEILIRFRRHKVAISADIKSMFLQIRLNPEQWDLQRIFWREHTNEPLKEYWMVVVIFGLASSPFLAVRSMLDIEPQLQEQFPKAVNVIRNDFYMDDCITGAPDEESAIKLAKELKTVLEHSGFPLCKWVSNNETIVQIMDGEEAVSCLFEEREQPSVLGLKWLVKTDEFTYEVRSEMMSVSSTKREILSQIGRLYDPNGFIAPVITRAKILMREVWNSKLNWDDRVPKEIEKNWESIKSTMRDLEQIRIPRWIGMETDVQLQLHGFADSSVLAYGCSIYVRVQKLSGHISCYMIASKSKIAPIKEVSIPRLELTAVELLSKFFVVVRDAMELKTVPQFLWSDSSTALQWLRKPLHELKVFVSNRVKTIQSLTNIENWRHVRTADNPADLVSRGVSAREMVHNKLWWYGPSWLSEPQEQWPEPMEIGKMQPSAEVQAELRVHTVLEVKNELTISLKGTNEEVPLLQYVNDLQRVSRILGYVMRFVRNCRDKCRSKPFAMTTRSRAKKRTQVQSGLVLLSEEEKREALQYFIRNEQMLAFPKEYQYLKEQSTDEPVRTVQKDSKIIKLTPFLDKNGILRAGSRLCQSDLPYDTKFPVIIPPKSRLSYLIAWEAHQATKHGSTQIMIQYIRANYWIPRLRLELRSYLAKCITCIRFAKKFESQLMSGLPADRVQRHRPFLITGVDYAGPFELTERYKSRSSKRKCWIAIFVCMVTRAIHIDIVTDASSAAFIACFDRFVARRGHCNKLYSDNGSSFVGAEKEIKAAYANWHSPAVQEHVNKARTKWVFMKPSAPHQGGIYEAAVKSCKHHLKRVIGAKTYTYEHLITFLLQVEAILNSRPLYAMSDDPTDMQILCPGHFIIGEPFILPPPIAAPAIADFSLKRIRAEQQKMLSGFWDSWRKDYLSTLLPRKKWTQTNEFKLGQLVLICEDNIAPAHWEIGRIKELIKSKDGLVRSVVILRPTTVNNNLLKRKTIVRPVQKLCLLPIMPEPEPESTTEREK